MKELDNIFRYDTKNNIVNLSSSIMKHFGLKPFHKTIDYVDNVLVKDKDNVILMIYDGLGLDVMNKTLDKDSFLLSNLHHKINSIFPPTTACCTTSIMGGKYPIEHGYVGWDIYFKDIDKIVTIFKNHEKDNENNLFNYNVAEKYLPYKKIVDLINEETNYDAYELLPFGENKYDSLNDMFVKLEKLCKIPGKKYIYCYYNEPDHTLHYNSFNDKTISLIEELDNKTKQFVKKLSNYDLIITADHGHIECEQIVLSDYPDFINLLERNTSTEGRACSFWVKKGKEKEFTDMFNELFRKDFILLSKKEVLENDLFGYGKSHKNFESSIGDYMAIAIKNKYFEYYYYDDDIKTQHGGLTKEEIEIPLIIVSD